MSFSEIRNIGRELRPKLSALAKSELAATAASGLRSAKDMRSAAATEMEAWSREWHNYCRHTDPVPDRPFPSIFRGKRFFMFAGFNLAGLNPFGGPCWRGYCDGQYIERWQLFWFATPERRQVLREALEIEKTRRTSKGRVRLGALMLGRDDLYERQSRRCHICGRWVSRNAYHLDHLRPIAWGGKTTLENLQVSCPGCNLRKGSRLPGLKKNVNPARKS